MIWRHVRVVSVLVLAALNAAGVRGEPTWEISPPIVKGDSPAKEQPAVPAPRRKEEARAAEELSRLPIDTIYVEGRADSEFRKGPPQTAEQRFAAALNAGNPEVAGGKIRHGMFYDGGVYWASDPLSFIYYNIANRLKD